MRQVITCFLIGEQAIKCDDTLEDAAMHAIFQTVGGDKRHLDVVATADVSRHPVDTSSERFLIRNVDFGIWLQNNKKNMNQPNVLALYLSTKRCFVRFVDE